MSPSQKQTEREYRETSREDPRDALRKEAGGRGPWGKGKSRRVFPKSLGKKKRKRESERVLQSFGVDGQGLGLGWIQNLRVQRKSQRRNAERRVRARVQGVRGRGPHRPPHVPGSALFPVSPQTSPVSSQPRGKDRQRACAPAHTLHTDLDRVEGPRPQDVT